MIEETTYEQLVRILQRDHSNLKAHNPGYTTRLFGAFFSF